MDWKLWRTREAGVAHEIQMRSSRAEGSPPPHYPVLSKEEADPPMTIILPLQPQEEARLMAVAGARGISAAALVREALHGILADASVMNSAKEPARSLRGLLARYGPAPSSEEIDRNRAEMFANFPRSDS